MESNSESISLAPESKLIRFTDECPYLPGHKATQQGFYVNMFEPRLYRELLDHNYRRSGLFLYRPACANCHECRQLRVLVSQFTPSRSQRRCLLRNTDLRFTIDKAKPTLDKYKLYERYLIHRHKQHRDNIWFASPDFGAFWSHSRRKPRISIQIRG